MKSVDKIVALLLLILTTGSAVAQQGTIRGSVIEDATGETLIGVTVLIKGTTKGAVTDFDGKFEIRTEPGNYDIQISFVSYETITISDVVLEAGEVTLLENIRLKESVEELEEVVVTADVIKNSESALLTVKRKSANLMDGISAANFRKIGDSDAAAAAKRVTGVSVEGGKYVYVRGLGDRYTKTTLNNVDIPGLDPDRNSIQIDIFPTNLIDNMIILKSFTADLPADFTGGIVNIETKDFPEEKIVNASASISYNPSMHFNPDYLDYEGGSTDFLGFDDGTRGLPNEARVGNIELPSPVNGTEGGEVNDFLNDFSSVMGPTTQTSFMNYSLGLTLANQKALKNDHKLGYIFSASYKNDSRFYDEAVFGEYQKPNGAENYELVLAGSQRGQLAENSVLLGGLAGLAYKTRSSKFKFNVLRLQNGERRSAAFSLLNTDAGGKSDFTGNSFNAEYNERALTNFFLNGEHVNEDASWKVDWKAAYTLSTLDDPDIRRVPYSDAPQGPDFRVGEAGYPTRLWRELDEINIVGKVDVTRELELFMNPAKLKFGVSQVYKERDYEIRAYSIRFFPDTISAGFWTGEPNEVWVDELLYPEGPIYLQGGNPDPNPNKYNSNVNNTAAYISSELMPTEKLKAIIGLRIENFVQRHTGRNQSGERVLDNDIVLDNLNLFPSANFIYSLSDMQNLRASYSRTVARPSFKELSFAQILDPVSNRTFNGGFFEYEGDWDGNLISTLINNFDLRWEFFQNRGQLFSVSAFYKQFSDPIELVRIPVAVTTNEFQPRNVGDGQLYGLEFELRKSLDFLSPDMRWFSVSGNLTLVESQIDMTDAEFQARKSFEKAGEAIEDTRDMAGQAPWIVNAGFSYNNPEIGLDAGLFYNVKGPTLTVVGGNLFPDVYSEPFHSLNFNLNKTFGAKDQAAVNFGINNILNDVREEFYTGFRAEDQIFNSLNPGTQISLGISYSF